MNRVFPGFSTDQLACTEPELAQNHCRTLFRVNEIVDKAKTIVLTCSVLLYLRNVTPTRADETCKRACPKQQAHISRDLTVLKTDSHTSFAHEEKTPITNRYTSFSLFQN